MSFPSTVSTRINTIEIRKQIEMQNIHCYLVLMFTFADLHLEHFIKDCLLNYQLYLNREYVNKLGCMMKNNCVKPKPYNNYGIE